MNKQQKAAEYKRLIDMAQTSRQALLSGLAVIAHVESEATSALLELGNSVGQFSRGKIKQIQENFTEEQKYLIRYGRKMPKTK